MLGDLDALPTKRTVLSTWGCVAKGSASLMTDRGGGRVGV